MALAFNPLPDCTPPGTAPLAVGAISVHQRNGFTTVPGLAQGRRGRRGAIEGVTATQQPCC